MTGDPTLRSQFLIGITEQVPDGLVRLPFGPVAILAGPDLPHRLSPRAAVLGHAVSIDEKTVPELIEALPARVRLADVHGLARRLAGRFVVVAQTEDGIALCPDALCSKDVFISPDRAVACSSEMLLARTIDHPIRPVSDAAAVLLDSSAFEARESSFIGRVSPMTGFDRMTPNHVAVLGQSKQRVIEPSIPSEPVDVATIARSFTTMVSRLGASRPLRLGLTAGFDSRLVLAACLNAGVDIECFTFTDGNDRKTSDSTIAAALCDHVSIPFHLVREPVPADDTVKDLLERSQCSPRSNRHVVAQLDWYRTHPEVNARLTLSGMGGEISRSKFGLVPHRLGKRLTRAAVLGNVEFRYDIDAFNHWWDTRFEQDHPSSVPTTTHFHWEQRVGVWGSQFLDEKDLFMDEVPAFSSLALQEQLLSHPQHLRSSLRSKLFLDLISAMSPELASFGPPPSASIQHRVYYATPAPHILRSIVSQRRLLATGQ